MQISQNQRIYAMHFFLQQLHFNILVINYFLKYVWDSLSTNEMYSWNPVTKPVLDTDLQSLLREYYVPFLDLCYESITQQKQFRKET